MMVLALQIQVFTKANILEKIEYFILTTSEVVDASDKHRIAPVWLAMSNFCNYLW